MLTIVGQQIIAPQTTLRVVLLQQPRRPRRLPSARNVHAFAGTKFRFRTHMFTPKGGIVQHPAVAQRHATMHQQTFAPGDNVTGSWIQAHLLFTPTFINPISSARFVPL
jgi:hypothetical protein